MHPRTKIVERNADQISAGNELLVYGPPASDDLSFLSPGVVITTDYRVYNSLKKSSDDESVLFGLEFDNNKLFDSAVIYIPKSKPELDMVLAFVSARLKENADIYLVGEKKAGISSAAKKLDQYGFDASKIDSAAHCQLWHVSHNSTGKDFDLEDWYESYSVEVKDINVDVEYLPGVFSKGEIDEATKLLMDNMFYKLKGRVLDFGCGAGVLGVYTKLLNPSIDLEMVDLSWLALKSAERTANKNEVEAKIYASDGWNDIKGRVQGVVTNPPFHQGIDTEYNTTENFIKQAKDKMARHAPLLLVANNFLRYSPIIESALGRCDIHAENNKFRVYKAYR